ncbi:tetratricopeptide repeat protein [Allosphingosinicella sp.]|uniref:tetratricopeptide repeat protein n=1 Tax=Allosphingosinicella sp. TaxID=2823234 RepID=UPI002FC1E487
MRSAKSLILPLALLLSSTSVAAQLSKDDLTELDTLAADENGESTATQEEAEEAVKEPPVEAETPADETMSGGPEGLLAKLASLAAEGNGEAAYHLGMAYHLGANGVEKDPQKAFELFTQSAETGDPLGAYMLGSYYEGEGGEAVETNPELALKYKLASAEAGHALAQHDVAQHFYEQDDTDEALEYLLASAKQGHVPSLQALASLYSGEGKVAKDPVKQFAYVALLQGNSAEAPSKRIQEWRDKMQAELSEEQLKEAMQLVDNWKVEPSEVTRKALSGEAAAMKLAGADAAPTELPAADSKEAQEGR